MAAGHDQRRPGIMHGVPEVVLERQVGQVCIPMRAVQIWVFTAFELVPRYLPIFRLCLIALNKSNVSWEP